MYGRPFWIVVFLLLALPPAARAFEFDVWRSGMGLSQILATAQDNDLPIAPSNLIHINKRYNHQIASKDAGKHTSYKYVTRLLEWPATITLQLTPYTRELHTVDVSWITPTATKSDRELLNANLVQILSQKYGEFSRPLPGSLGEVLFSRGAKQWSPSPTDRVLVETRSGNTLQLHYVDLTLKDKAAREDEALRRNRAGQGRAADAGRF